MKGVGEVVLCKSKADYGTVLFHGPLHILSSDGTTNDCVINARIIALVRRRHSVVVIYSYMLVVLHEADTFLSSFIFTSCFKLTPLNTSQDITFF